MGKITGLSLQKNKNRANVFLDGRFVCGMDTETIVKNGLKVGQEITIEKLSSLQSDSEVNKAFDKCLSLLERQLYTKKQIARKLAEKGYLAETIDSAINKLGEYGYVDDKIFAKSFASANQRKSKKELKYKLLQKGVSAEIIENTVAEVDPETERDNAVLAAEKYMRRKEPTKENLTKLFSYLMGKGFGAEDVKFAVRQFNKELDYD